MAGLAITASITLALQERCQGLNGLSLRPAQLEVAHLHGR